MADSNNPYDSEYDNTTTGYASTIDDIDEGEDDYRDGASNAYEDSTGMDSTLHTEDAASHQQYNGYQDGETYNTNPEEGDYDPEDGGEPYNDYNAEDNARYNPGVGETYDANVEAPEEYDAYGAPPGSTRQYNPDYDYDGESNFDRDMYDEDYNEEQTPLNPSVRSYNNFDRDEEFNDEYDSDEEDVNKQSSFYRGREQYEYRTDEAEEQQRVKKIKKRNLRDATTGMKVVAAICCCCICIITILILLLVFLVFKDEADTSSGGSGGRNNNGRNPTGRTPRPTPRPTYPIPPALRPALEGRPDVFSPWIRVTDEPTKSAYPTNIASDIPTDHPTGVPTPKPTLSMAPTRPVPPTITLPAIADTYVYVDGFFQYEAYGTEDTFLVQNGLAEYYEFADAMGLIQFDLRTLPTKGQMEAYDAQAILRLNHLPVNEKFSGRDPSTISVRKLLSTPMRIETLHGGLVDREPVGSIKGENNVTVGLNQDLVLLDVSDLLYPVNFTEDGYDRKQLLLMLFNNSTEQGDPQWSELEWQNQAGDRFKSVESGDGPSLTITYVPR